MYVFHSGKTNKQQTMLRVHVACQVSAVSWEVLLINEPHVPSVGTMIVAFSSFPKH